MSKIACGVALLFILPGCSMLGETEMSLLYQEQIYNRRNAMAVLRQSVRANMAVCSANNAAGLYTIEQIIPSELKYTNYYAASIDRCALFCMALPCGASLNQSFQSGSINKDDNLNVFLPILRSCNIQPAGLNP